METISMTTNDTDTTTTIEPILTPPTPQQKKRDKLQFQWRACSDKYYKLNKETILKKRKDKRIIRKQNPKQE